MIVEGVNAAVNDWPLAGCREDDERFKYEDFVDTQVGVICVDAHYLAYLHRGSPFQPYCVCHLHQEDCAYANK
jgi:hypothetical protein